MKATCRVSPALKRALAAVEVFGAPKLSVEVVPKTSHFANLRTEVKRSSWDRVRKEEAERAGQRCEVCGGRGKRHPVECHEIWSYDDRRRVQKLEGLVCLCTDCHMVKHIGRQIVLGFGDEAKAHLVRVNEWTWEQAEAYVSAAGRVCFERSKHEWRFDLSWAVERGMQFVEHKPGR